MTYKGWLIYNKQDSEENASYINWFIEEAKLQNAELSLIIREDIIPAIVDNNKCIHVNGKKMNLPDFAVVRTIDPLLSLHLEQLGVRVFNSSTVSQICNDKALTHQHISQLNIPMVSTYFTTRKQLEDDTNHEFPFVIKETTGRSGKQVFLINNEYELVANLPRIHSTTIIKQSSKVIHGKDLRVFVIGKEIVGAVLRENKKDFRANFKLGGSATWYSLNESEKRLIDTIINYFSFDMVGIDFLFSVDGTLQFNEIEDVVGSRTLSAVSDINILQKYMKHIINQL